MNRKQVSKDRAAHPELQSNLSLTQLATAIQSQDLDTSGMSPSQMVTARRAHLLRIMSLSLNDKTLAAKLRNANFEELNRAVMERQAEMAMLLPVANVP